MNFSTSSTSLINMLNQIEHYQPDSMPVDQARSIIDAFVQPIPTLVDVGKLESCPIFSGFSALNRILAEDIISPINVPAHDNSAMDGYAFRGEQLQEDKTALILSCQVVGIALTGHPFNQEIAVGECVKIMTGAPMPPNCDTVIAQELCDTSNDQCIHFAANAIKAKQNRRLKGEDLTQDCIALTKGKMITPADLGLLASLGVVQVKVYRKLKVVFFSTGDELQSLGEILREGCVYDSNRATLFGMLSNLHFEAIDLGIIQDNPQALKAIFQHACDDLEADVIITSGGVSSGVADHTKLVMNELGDCAFWNLNMRPGRPFAFGTVQHNHKSSYVFGLPGNPVAMMVSFSFLVREALQKMMGANKLPLLLCSAMSSQIIKKRLGRTEYQRGIASMTSAGQLEVKLTGAQGSGILRSMSEANCIIVLAESQSDVAIGDVVQLILLHGLL